MDKTTVVLPGYIKTLSILVILVLCYIILEVGKDVLVTFSVALFLSFLLLPVSTFFQRKGIPKGIAIILSILLAFCIIVGLISFFAYQIMSFQDDFPQLREAFLEKYKLGQKYIESNYHYSRRKQTAWVNLKVSELTADASTYVMGALSTTGALLANLAIIPIYVFFLSFYQDKIMQFIYSMIEEKNKRKAYFAMTKVCRVSQQYIKGLLIDILILSVLNSTGFLLLGLKHAILFGVLAAILNIIPYIGVMIGSFFPVALAFLTMDSAWYAVGAAGVCILVQFLDNNFITPKVVGSSVSINPLAAIVVLMIGAKLWGVIGMVLAIPVTGMFKVLFDQIYTMRPIGFLLGEEKNFDRVKTRVQKLKAETKGSVA